MQQIDQAIDLKKENLAEVCEIEKEALSLEEMRVKRQEEREAWDKDRQDRNAKWQSEVDEYKQKRERSEEEYSWNTHMQHKRVEEDFQARMEAAKRAEQVRAEELEREWADREKALAAKENEFAALKDQVDAGGPDNCHTP